MNLEVVKGSDAARVDPEGIPWPADSIVVFALNGDGAIKGRAAVVILPHIEGTWVAESERGSPLAYRMVRRIEEILKESGRTHAFAFVEENRPEIRDYLVRTGYGVMPLTVLSKEL